MTIPAEGLPIELSFRGENGAEVPEAPLNLVLKPGDQNAIKIGRAKKNEVKFDLKGLSWHHAELRLLPTPSGFRVFARDVSSNGTGLREDKLATPLKLPKDQDTPLQPGASLFIPLKVKPPPEKVEAGKEQDTERPRVHIEVNFVAPPMSGPPPATPGAAAGDLAAVVAAADAAVAAASGEARAPPFAASGAASVPVVAPTPLAAPGTAPRPLPSPLPRPQAMSLAAAVSAAAATAAPTTLPAASKASSGAPPPLPGAPAGAPASALGVGREMSLEKAQVMCASSKSRGPAPPGGPAAPAGAALPPALSTALVPLPSPLPPPPAAPGADAQAQAQQQQQFLYAAYMQQAQMQAFQAMQMQQLQQMGALRPPLLPRPPVKAGMPFGAPAPPLPPEKQEKLDKCCTKFNLDERVKDSFQREMAKRLDTFDDDMELLDDILGNARNPPGMLSVKLRDMRQGTFGPRPGQPGARGSGAAGAAASAGSDGIPNASEFSDQHRKALEDFIKEYQFDQRLIKRLSEAMAKRKDSFDDDLAALQRAMKTARSPGGLLSVKLGDMENGTFQAHEYPAGRSTRGVPIERFLGERGGGGGESNREKRDHGDENDKGGEKEDKEKEQDDERKREDRGAGRKRSRSRSRRRRSRSAKKRRSRSRSRKRRGGNEEEQERGGGRGRRRRSRS